MNLQSDSQYSFCKCYISRSQNRILLWFHGNKTQSVNICYVLNMLNDRRRKPEYILAKCPCQEIEKRKQIV